MSRLFRFLIVWPFKIGVISLAVLIVSIVLLRFLPMSTTPLMLKRFVEAPFTGHTMMIDQQWADYDDISPWVFRGVIAGEDGGFMRHEGVDWRAVENAKRANPGRIKRGKPPLGASTITMQCARNAFLLPFRNMVRKAFEVGITYVIEFIWGKKRILEVYVNIIEWGDGIYGIQAASRHYFGKAAKDLTRDEAARLAAVVPNPRRFHVNSPSPYTKKRIAFVKGRMGVAVPR
ncbi:MAG: monofunctional biosynthetic peptidoglycan transglycosylase [Ignavibacteriae bacterium]|nr:MAG: monofunctional biosynthetic peptidoglycan transglycosylase [Ignavibacteriota bacterium]